MRFLGKTLEDVLEAALSCNIELQLSRRHLMSQVSMEKWLRDTCTIRVDCGRMCGKTTLIKNSATSRDLVVVHCKPVQKIVKNIGIRAKVVSDLRPGDPGPVFVYVDNASLFPEESMIKMYEWLASRPTLPRAIVLLG